MKAQLLLDIELGLPDVCNIVITRLYDAKWEAVNSKPLGLIRKGEPLTLLQEALKMTVREMVDDIRSQVLAAKPPAPPPSGFGDNMSKHAGDGIQIGLQCSHPNVAPETHCPFCGQLAGPILVSEGEANG